MAFRFTRSKAEQSYEEDSKAREEKLEREEKMFCERIDKLVPGATRKTFEFAFGNPDTNLVSYVMGVSGLYSKVKKSREATVQILKNALEAEKEKKEEEKKKKREMKEEKKKFRLKRRRVLETELAAMEAELAALKDEEEKNDEEED